jgi:serine/threonine-protein kinase
MPNRPNDWIGLALAGGRYEVIDKLGEGGMGFVYRARDRNLDADVVIKVPRASMLDDPEFVHRFSREVRSLVKLAHPCIVKVTDVGEHGGVPFAVMQYLPGGSLEDRRSVGGEGRYLPAEPSSVPAWLTAVAEALDYVHSQGFVHRDIKPGNILFDAQGHAFLSDFGVAKALATGPEARQGRTAATGTGMVLGTPEYMAPELIMGEPFDGRADQYALAVTVYEMLCGRRPFEGTSPTALLVLHTTKEPPPLCDVHPALPRVLSDSVLRGLAKEPARRYPSCAAFAAAVRTAVASGGAAPAAAGGTSVVAKPVRIECPSCHKKLVLSAKAGAALKAGHRLPCPACQAPLGAAAAGTRVVAAPQREPAPAAARVGTTKLSASAVAPTPAGRPEPPRTWREPAQDLPARKKAANSVWPWVAGGAAAALVFMALSAALVYRALAPRNGLVRVQLPAFASDAEVELDERRYAARELKAPLELPPGEHRLTVRKPGCDTYDVAFEVIRGETVDLPVGLTRRRPAPPVTPVTPPAPRAQLARAEPSPRAEPEPPPPPRPEQPAASLAEPAPSPAQNLVVATPKPLGPAKAVDLPLEAILATADKFADQVVIPAGLYRVGRVVNFRQDGAVVLPAISSGLVLQRDGSVAVASKGRSTLLEIDPALAERLVSRGTMRKVHDYSPPVEMWGENVAILTLVVLRAGPPGSNAWALRIVRAEFLIDLDFLRIGKGLYAKAFKSIALAPDDERAGLGDGDEWARRLGLHFTNGVKSVYRRLKNQQSDIKWAQFNATMNRMIGQGIQQSIRANDQFNNGVMQEMTRGRRVP